MKTTTSRSYELRIAKRHERVCAETHQMFTRGASLLMEFWTDLFGGFDPSFLPSFEMETKRIAKDGQNKKSNLVISAQAHAFTLWFHPTNRKVSTKDVVPTSQLRKRFLAYWGKCSTVAHLDPALEHLFATLGDREGVNWVDCRGRFLRLGIHLNEITPVGRLWPLYFDGDDDDRARSLQSKMWPKQKQTNYENLFAFYGWITSWLPKQVGQPWSKVEGQVAAKFSQAETGKRGAPTRWKYLLGNKKRGGGKAKQEEVEEILEHVNANWTKNKADSDIVVAPWMERAQRDIGKALGIAYKFDVWAEMTSLAMSRYLSWRSNFLRQLSVRVEAYKVYQEARQEEVPLPWVDDLLSNHKRQYVKDQDYLAASQVRGFHRVLNAWGDLESRSAEALSAEVARVEADMGQANFGERKLFDTLAVETARQGAEPEDVCQSIEKILDREDAERSYRMLRSPVLTWIDADHPQHPWFGVSKPYGEITIQPKRESGPYLGEATLRMFRGGEFADTDILVIGKRFFKELYFSESGVEVSRDHPLIRKLHQIRGGNLKPVVQAKDISLQLVPRNGHWYLKATVKFPQIPPPTVKSMEEVVASGGQLSILAVDRGFRNPIAFAHLRTNAGKLQLKNEHRKGSLRFEVVESGLLRERQMKDGEEICRLNGGRRRPPTAEELALWRKVRVKTGKFAQWVPEDQVTLYRALSDHILSLVRQHSRRRDIDGAMAWLKTGVDAIVGQRGKPGTGHDKGGLSLDRMSAFRNLKSAATSIVSVCEKDGKPAPKIAVELEELLNRRLNAIRREAVLVSSSLIIGKALEIGATVIAVEDLDFYPQKGNSRRSNRRLNDWCCRRLVTELQAQNGNGRGGLYGLFVKTVPSMGTSLEDFSTDFPKPKFDRKTLVEIRTDSFRKKLAAQLRRKGGVRDELIRLTWRHKAEQYKVACKASELVRVLEREASETGCVYVPSFFGSFYYSTDRGWMDSDVSAAVAVGKRALRSLLGWYARERGSGEIGSEKDNARKSFMAKVQGLWLTGGRLSRVVSANLPNSWAALPPTK